MHDLVSSSPESYGFGKGEGCHFPTMYEEAKALDAKGLAIVPGQPSGKAGPRPRFLGPGFYSPTSRDSSYKFLGILRFKVDITAHKNPDRC